MVWCAGGLEVGTWGGRKGGGSASVGGRRLLRRMLADRSGSQVERWVAVASNSSAGEHEGGGVPRRFAHGSPC